MSREPFAKLHASQVIEDLLADSAHNSNQQNWLLSYLDVFVLIIMLVITLLAITDESPPSQQKQSSKKVAQKQNKPSKKKPKSIQIANKTALAKFSSHSNKKRDPKKASANNTKSPPSLLIEEKAITAEKKKSEIRITKQELAKSIQAESVDHVSKTPEIKKPPSDSQVSSGTQSSQEAEKNKDVDKARTTEPKSKIEKLLVQKPEVEEKKWQYQLKKQLDNFEFVNVKINQGYAQIEIQDNILFDSAQSLLTEEGMALLKKLAVLLKKSTGIIFIEGHTDNQPIATQQFPSNWELGSARATSVLHFFTSQELNGKRLRAVTYADTMPIADNFTEEGRSKNRRVNLLVKIPEI